MPRVPTSRSFSSIDRCPTHLFDSLRSPPLPTCSSDLTHHRPDQPSCLSTKGWTGFPLCDGTRPRGPEAVVCELGTRRMAGPQRGPYQFDLLFGETRL